MFIACAALLGLCLLLLIVSFSRADELVNVPGTPILMQPPQGFALSDDFSGFVNKDNNASIVIAIIPDKAASFVSSVFTNEDKFTKAMASYGFVVEKQRELQRENSQVPLQIYSGIQTAGEQKYHKWVTLIAHGGLYMITIQAPEKAILSQDDVDAAFQSVDFNASFTLDDQIAQLPFFFVSAPPFQAMATILGSGVSLTVKDAQGNKDDAKIFIVRDTQMLDKDNPILAQNIYLASIMPSFKLQNTMIERDEPFLQRNGRLLVGSGISLKGEEQDIILYSAIDHDHHPVYLQALAPKGQLVNYQDIIKNIAHSVTSKK